VSELLLYTEIIFSVQFTLRTLAKAGSREPCSIDACDCDRVM